MREFFSRRPAATLVAVTFIWGSTFIVTKQVVREMAPLPYLTMRFGLAAIVLLALFRSTVRAPRQTWRDGTLLGVLQASGLMLQVFGQLYTTASKSAFVTALSTALTPLLGFALYGDRPRRQHLVGVLLATAGLVLLTYPQGEAEWNRGDLYALACALIYAFVIVETARRAPRSSVGELAAVQTTVGALLFLLLLAISRALIAWLPAADLPSALAELLRIESRPFHLDGAMALQVIYMAIICTVVTFLAQTWAMGRMSAIHAAVVFALEPVFATGLAIAVEGGSEWPGSRGAVGALFILAGLLASEIRLAGRPRWPRQVLQREHSSERENAG